MWTGLRALPHSMMHYESYHDHESHLPSTGRFIIAQFDADSIVVYQAFNEAIAAYAVEHGRFGGPAYDEVRITHLKPSFLWMMHYSGWAKKDAQEHVLAIRLSRDCFDDLLRRATLLVTDAKESDAEVQLSWQPYHDLHGAKTDRFAAKIGLLGEARRQYNETCIQSIEDITPFVRQQQELLRTGKEADVQVPSERAYAPQDFSLLLHVGATSISM